MLQCSHYKDEQRELLDIVKGIFNDKSLIVENNEQFIHILLHGSNKLDFESNITIFKAIHLYIRATRRFDN